MKPRDLLMFVAGCVAGCVGASLYLKPKYEQYAQEKIDSIKEREERWKKGNCHMDISEDVEEYADDQNEERIVKAQEAARNNANKSDITDYKTIVKENGYRDYNSISKPENEDQETKVDPISYIPPNLYGLDDDYEQIELTYYMDGILADECGDVVDDIQAKVGNEFDDHFGEYEDTVVYVKNDELKTYYVISMSDDEYREIFDM